MAKGGFGGFGGGNMQQLMRQAQKMQQDMEQAQQELGQMQIEASAGGGMVKVKINGKREILHIDIQPDIVDPDDIETLADVVTAAVNEAIKKVDSTSESEMQKITGGLNIPGLL